MAGGSSAGSATGASDPFRAVSGEMAERVRGFDWAATPLGPISGWPQSLKTAVGMVLLSPVPIVMLWGEDGIMIYNDAYSVFAGGRHPSLLGSKVREGWPEVADFNDNVMKVGLAGGTLAYRDHELSLNRTGTLQRAWLNLDYSPILDDGGRPAGVMAIVVETTARVLADEALRRSEEKLRLATENAGIGLWDIDAQGAIDFSYSRERSPFVMAQNERVPMEHLLTRIHPDDAQRLREAYDASRDPETRPMLDVEYRVLQTDDAPLRWIKVRGRGVFDENGNCLRVSGTALDITRERETQEALKQSEEQLRLATENAEIGLWDMDVLHNIAYSTPRVKAMFGFPPQSDPAPDEFFALVHPGDIVRVQQAYASAFDPLKRATYDVEYRVIGRDDGIERWIHAKGRGVFDAGGGLLRVTGTAIDITARKAIEQEIRDLNETLEKRVAERTAALEKSQAALQQAQKMEAIGNLTGGIAHDFNNLLQGLTGSLDLIRNRPQDAERVRRWAEAGLQAAERGAKLTAQLLAFSRSQKLEMKPLDISGLLGGMRDLLGRTLGPSVRVTLDLSPEIHSVLGDETQLEMAVLNLAINARDAMDGTGALVIRTRPYRAAPDGEIAAGDYAELSVTDTGCGMPPDVIARAFDPFFTTKDVGKGTGLGLSQVYAMARQAGGTARIASAPGEGTTVSILLRATRGEAAKDSGVVRKQVRPTAPATILVVDDDPGVRQFLSESLDTFGYAVLAAEDGAAGLDMLERMRPDLVIVDYAMPGMTGAQLAAHARAKHPDLPIIFASGYAETSALESALDANAQILRKPFRLEDLHAAIAKVLR
ncbi:MAG: PAS domain S-box protein [Rhizomicrobium sp.]